MTSSPRPWVTTFYSYKGGVGRTTLAVNVAVALARVGKTLLWDLDIEAPGLQHITALKAGSKPTGGYFTPLRRWQEAGWPATLTEPALTEWDACLWPVQAQPGLFILPAAVELATQMQEYVQIDWAEAFGRQPEKGLALIDALLTHWHRQGFEFVVIDSRTGITDAGALLTAVVPDMTLLVGNFGVQNVAGLDLVWRALQSATAELPERVQRGRGPLVRELVASPVPTTDATRIAAGREIWTRHFQRQPSQWLEIPENDDLRFSERIALLEYAEDHPLVSRYRAVAQRVLAAHEAASAAQREDAQATSLYPEVRALQASERLGRDGPMRLESPPRFEERVAQVLELLRYQVQRAVVVDGLQIDLVARATGTLEDVAYYVECKDSKVGVEPIRQLAAQVAGLGAAAHGARPMVVARSFSPAALVLAGQLHTQCFTLEQLETRLFDFEPYLAQLRAAFEQSNLAKCYVEQSIQRESAAAQAGQEPSPTTPLLTRALAWARGEGKPLWVLLGDYGTGKSAFMQRLAYELAQQRQVDARLPAPVLINLRDYPNATNLETVIDEHLVRSLGERLRGKAAALLHLLGQGRCVLLLDSFDEMGLAAAGVSTEEQFRQLARPTHGTRGGRGGRVLITSREEFFRERKEVLPSADSAAAGGRAASGLEQAARAFDAEIDTLSYFSREQVSQYLALRLGPAAGAAALERIEAVHGLRDLATRPQLLEIVLESLPDLLAAGRAVNAGALYFTYVNRWLQRHRPTASRLQPDEVLQLLESLAQVLWARGAAPLHYSQLLDLVRSLQSLFPLRDPVHVDLELRTAAFLTRSPDGHYRFSHRSFLEFFYARRLVRLIEAQDGAGLVLALSAPALRVEVVRFLADLWQATGHEQASVLSAHLLAVQQPPPAAANLLRLALMWADADARAASNTQPEWAANAAPHAAPNGSATAAAAATAATPVTLAANLAAALTANRQRLLPQAPAAAQLAGCNLAGMDLSGAPLAGACLDQAVLDNANLMRVDLRGASLRSARASDAVFDGAHLGNLQAHRLIAHASSWRNTQAAGANFSGAGLRNSEWRGADLTGACFEAADLTSARLNAAHAVALSGVDLGDVSVLAGLAQAPNGVATWLPSWRELIGRGGLTLAYAPDGATLAAAGADGSVRLWDAVSGAERRVIEGHDGAVSCLAYSPGGATLASAGADGSVRLWDAASGVQKRVLNGRLGAVNSLAYAPDGATLASAGSDGSVRLWDAASGAQRRVLRGHAGRVASVAYAPDGSMLASAGDDGSVRLWDAVSGDERHVLNGHDRGVASVAYAPDGSMLASAGDDGSVRLWDAASGVERRVLKGHAGWVNSLAYAPDGATLASAGADGSVRLWDAASGAERSVLKGHDRWVSSLVYAPDGATLAGACFDGSVRLWDVASGDQRRLLKGHGQWVTSLAYAPDGATLASAGDDGRVRLCDAASGAERRVLRMHFLLTTTLAYAPDGATLAGAGADGSVRLWDAVTGVQRRVLNGHAGRVNSLAYAPDGATLASAGGDGSVRLWDAASGAQRRVLKGHDGGVISLAYAPDGATLASAGADGSVRLWDAAGGDQRHVIKTRNQWVSSVAFAPDGATLVSAGNDGCVQLWDPASGAERRVLKGHDRWVSSLAYAPDGATLASAGDDGSVRLWDTASGVQRCVLRGLGGAVTSLAYSPDGAMLACAGALLTVFDIAKSTAPADIAVETPVWRYQARLTPAPDPVALLYHNGSHSGSPEALEWLVYEQPPEDASTSAWPKLHRASDVPWRLHRPDPSS